MYVVERWLARLSLSSYADDFVLKGGMLLAAFGNRRPTVDAYALARNMSFDQKTVAARVAEISGTGRSLVPSVPGRWQLVTGV